MVTRTLALPEPSNPPGWVDWPLNLPRCVNTWEEQPVDPRIRTDMEIGRPKTRRRYTGVMRKVGVTFKLSNNDGGPNEEFIALRDFFEAAGNVTAHTGGTNGGYIFFKFISPADGVEHYYRFLSAPVMSSDGPLTFTAKMEWEEL